MTIDKITCPYYTDICKGTGRAFDRELEDRLCRPAGCMCRRDMYMKDYFEMLNELKQLRLLNKSNTKNNEGFTDMEVEQFLKEDI